MYFGLPYTLDNISTQNLRFRSWLFQMWLLLLSLERKERHNFFARMQNSKSKEKRKC